MKTCFGLAMSPSMFPEDCTLKMMSIDYHGVKLLVGLNDGNTERGKLVSCVNPSHKATMNALKARFGIEVPVPSEAPIVKLERGDALIVASIRGLPRLDATRHEYTEVEVNGATFEFSYVEVA